MRTRTTTTLSGCFCFFFFQAEDGIRDYKVTGVQTCALPISHAELRRITVERIEGYERLVGLRRILVAQLGQVVLAKIAVNASFIRAFSELGVVVADGLWPTEVAEAQADNSKSVGNAAFVLLRVPLIEIGRAS